MVNNTENRPGEDSEADDFFPPYSELETAGSETEDDLPELATIDFRDVVLAPSDWTVETILSQLKQHTFELDPDFQRRNAWTSQRKSKFIESLMLGLPIPQLVFAEREDEEGENRYIVIDGKQRLLALDAFYADRDPLTLTGLTVLEELNGKTRSDVLEDAALSRYAKRLSNRTIRTVVIRRWPDESFLHLVFHRINHQTLALSAQELRQALHPGPFTKFADTHAGSSKLLHDVLGASQRPDFRMRDVELLVRFIGYKLRITQYAGNLKRFLDETCSQFNDEWVGRESEFRATAVSCDRAIEVTQEIFGSDAFRRYSGSAFESRFNRAVFDVMCYYFSDDAIARAAEASSREVVNAFVNLSKTDSRFAESLSATTKTTAATGYRLMAWGNALRNALGPGVPITTPTPSESGKRIQLGGA